MNKLGTKTKSAVIYKHESHKLHQAFSVKEGEEILAGNPVKLETDGTISNYAGTGVYLGIAITPSDANMYPPNSLGKGITVAVQGYMITRGLASEAITETGYVSPVANHATESYYTYAPAGDDGEVPPVAIETKFIALNPAAAGDFVDILCLN